MGSFKRPHAFDPLDMEIIDLVYEVAWEQVSARDPSGDTAEDEERQASLRKRSSPSLATAELISTHCSTGCLRAYRSRLGHRRPTETTFSQQRSLKKNPLQSREGLSDEPRLSSRSCCGIATDYRFEFVAWFAPTRHLRDFGIDSTFNKFRAVQLLSWF